MYVEKLVKNFVHDLEYLIIWKQTKKTYFPWNDKVSLQSLASDMYVLFMKIKQLNQ